MKRSFAAAIVMGALITALALPMSALAFQVTGGGGNADAEPLRLLVRRQGGVCPGGLSRQDRGEAVPAQRDGQGRARESLRSSSRPPDSGLWPYTSPFGGITIQPRDLYLQVGDSEGFHRVRRLPGKRAGDQGGPRGRPAVCGARRRS